ncbi:MAG: hypothetical protein HUJ56_00245 [Erysipelotrichaceae bacterium]|nr:hypothetical protein [Erysipelotrichaceae bacterium]
MKRKYQTKEEYLNDDSIERIVDDIGDIASMIISLSDLLMRELCEEEEEYNMNCVALCESIHFMADNLDHENNYLKKKISKVSEELKQ